MSEPSARSGARPGTEAQPPCRPPALAGRARPTPSAPETRRRRAPRSLRPPAGATRDRPPESRRLRLGPHDLRSEPLPVPVEQPAQLGARDEHDQDVADAVGEI